MKNKIVIKNIKSKFYHKLINNEAIYDKNSINRYKKKTGNNEKSLNKNKFENLQSLKNKINSIKNCELKKSATNLVFSDGNPDAKIMIIGEGPGANEDKEGKPFVGRAGKLLDKMLESIKLNRKNVYISNVVNFRPPMNRKPTDEEIQRYLPFLIKHIELINPKILLLLGSTALNAIIGNEIVISKARGKWVNKKIGNSHPEVIASFHPAFLMRQPDQKKQAWEDLKMIRKKISDLRIKLNE
ncbi:MAG: uracil-DNA glycosylase [Pelagibacteraceae bacterium TMED124]|nr:MAG: uracil-DNA glycosylase [Pelagibacteraceae bacterium TMED124]|tara:strand:- start:590 stop:1315 length:726 start_codon:yes stop_codon:yes gene_type:complete